MIQTSLIEHGDLQNAAFITDFPKLWAYTDCLYRRLKHEDYGAEAIADLTIAGDGRC